MTSVTTKIYIKNYDPINIKKKFNKLDIYFRRKETIVELFSPEGLFIIENQQLYKLKPVDTEIHCKTLDDFELLFDSSYFNKELVLSQIPYDHINIETTKFYYGQEILGKKSFLRLVIEGLYEPDVINEFNKYENFKPTNFYFLITENFDNILVKKELNVFLSMLK